MPDPPAFQTVLDKYRQSAFSKSNKGYKFEGLMQAYLETDVLQSYIFKRI